MFRHTRIAACVALLTLGAAVLPGCRGGDSEAELMASARRYVEQRDDRAAVIQLKNVLSQNGSNAEARLLLGRSLLLGNDPANALLELRKAQELKASDEQLLPDLARAMLMLGQNAKIVEEFAAVKLAQPAAQADLLSSVASAHLGLGNRAKADEVAAAALQAKADHVPALLVQTQLQAMAGKTDEALALARKAVAIAPDDERAGIVLGELLWRVAKDTAGARKALEHVLSKHPEAVVGHTVLIAMLTQTGRTEEVDAQFARMKKALPNHPETVFHEAQAAFAAQDYKLARELTDRLLKVMPENPRVLELVGAAEFRLGNYTAAETFLLRALSNNPGQMLSRQLLGQTRLRAGQPSKALEALQPLTTGERPDAVALSLAGEAYLQLGETQKADAAFQAAGRADPSNLRVRTAVALVQAGRGNEQAVAELEKIAADDEGPRADLAVIAARLQKNDFAGALAAVDRLEKKMPARALPMGVRGQVLLRKNDIVGARKAFETALARDAKYFPAVASLSLIDLTENRPDAARQRFDAYAKANPGDPQPWLAQAELAARTGAPAAEVTRLAREAVRAGPAEPLARRVLIDQLITSGDFKGAVLAAQEALVTLPNNPDMAEAVGRAQTAAGDGRQAAQTFKQLTSQQPANAGLQVRLAEALLLNKDSSGAEAALKRALEIQPNLVLAQRGLVTLALLDKRPGDALAVARRVQSAQPRDAAGWLMEYEVEIARKNFDAAAVALRAALDRDKTTELAAKLHNTLLTGGKRAEADRWAADWLKVQPRDAAFRFYLGDMAIGRGDHAAAEALYRGVLELQPKNALALNNIAWLMVQQGKAGATALAEQATALLQDRAPLLDTLASALAADQQLARAVQTQKRAVALAPENATLRLNMARLYLKAGEKSYAREELETLAKLGDKFPGHAEVSALLKSL